MNGMDLTPQLFLLLTGLVADRVGLHYGTGDRDVFAGKVEARAADAGFTSLMDYYYYLRYDDSSGEELARLIDALLVHETYLFREPAALRVVADALAARADERPSVWSAACSTGEEPITLAMLLEERGVLDRVRIVASDVSVRALERARSGRLGRRAVRDPTPAAAVERWLRPDEAGWRADPKLVATVRWEHANLTSAEDVQRVGRDPFDIVVLRNVLIYFSDDTSRRVVRHVRSVLKPGGFIVLGASESLMRLGTGLRLAERAGTFVYQEPERS